MKNTLPKPFNFELKHKPQEHEQPPRPMDISARKSVIQSRFAPLQPPRPMISQPMFIRKTDKSPFYPEISRLPKSQPADIARAPSISMKFKTQRPRIPATRDYLGGVRRETTSTTQMIANRLRGEKFPVRR